MRISALAAALTVALAPIFTMPVAHADTICQDVPQVVAVGATSCPFALTIARSYLYGHNGPSFSAYSDVTNETYQVTCRIEQHGSTTCRTNPGSGVVVIY
jgi:hypothetical protein